jgi:molybdate-binding protein/DNA-binding XRE family transcriptional regulator
MIMSTHRQQNNRVRSRRIDRGWTQAELAQRAGISRPAVSAIEINRLVPSVAAALSLARTFGCSVEDLFRGGEGEPEEAAWAWAPVQTPCRYWHARVRRRTLYYPVESTPSGVIGHDGVFGRDKFAARPTAAPEETLIMASCDPAAGLLATQFARITGFRLLVLQRSSQHALSLLGQGLVHIAGVHLSSAHSPDRNAQAVKTTLGEGFNLLRVARWEEGLAVAPSAGVHSIGAAVRSRLRWVGREPGSAARACLDELLEGKQPPRHVARDHRGVAEAVRSGWADIGVCVRLVSEEAGLDFLTVRQESYELCFVADHENDPRIQALVKVLRSDTYRNLLADLPGYDSSHLGAIRRVR